MQIYDVINGNLNTNNYLSVRDIAVQSSQQEDPLHKLNKIIMEQYCHGGENYITKLKYSIMIRTHSSSGVP